MIKEVIKEVMVPVEIIKIQEVEKIVEKRRVLKIVLALFESKKY